MRCGGAWRGEAAHGKATVADGSTELRKKFPAALFREWTWLGVVGSGRARLGPAIAADGSTEHFGVPCCSL